MSGEDGASSGTVAGCELVQGFLEPGRVDQFVVAIVEISKLWGFAEEAAFEGALTGGAVSGVATVQSRHGLAEKFGKIGASDRFVAAERFGGEDAGAVEEELIEAAVADFGVAPVDGEEMDAPVGHVLDVGKEGFGSVIDVDAVEIGFDEVKVVLHVIPRGQCSRMGMLRFLSPFGAEFVWGVAFHGLRFAPPVARARRPVGARSSPVGRMSPRAYARGWDGAVRPLREKVRVLTHAAGMGRGGSNWGRLAAWKACHLCLG